ncbi:hypothetical protein VdG1_03941 [Verticillium dahliae VDG1]|nr:hypothetical protein VdG1_03941 [Verticillium dahliae VDG1]
MKITTHFTLLAMAAFGSAIAEKPTPVERDAPALVVRELAIVTGVINQVATDIGSLDQAGTASIQASNELTLQETVQLQQLLCDVVRAQVGEVTTGASGLIDAIVSKVPQAAQQIAAQMAAGFTRSLQDSAQGFSSQSCVNANNNGASGGTPVTNTTQPGQVSNPSGQPTQRGGASAQTFSLAAAIVAFGAAAVMA